MDTHEWINACVTYTRADSVFWRDWMAFDAVHTLNCALMLLALEAEVSPRGQR